MRDDDKLWTELLAHQEANMEERPEEKITNKLHKTCLKLHQKITDEKVSGLRLCEMMIRCGQSCTVGSSRSQYGGKARGHNAATLGRLSIYLQYLSVIFFPP